MTEVNPETVALARSPLAGVAPVSTVSATGGRRGILLEAMPAGCVLQIIARRGKAEAVRAALRAATGLEAPNTPARVAKHGTALIWSGPGQWLLTQEAPMAQAQASAMTMTMTAKVTAALAGLASLSDQSDARLQVRLSGLHVRDALAKLVGIDVHPEVFAPGAAAMTAIAHIPVHIWRLPDAGGEGAVFEIAGPQSMAASLWHHIVTAAEEYGLDARP